MSKSPKPRGRETFLDMARSMLALGVAVGLVLLVTWRPADSKPSVAPVNAHEVAIGAAAELSFTPLELSLGAQWKATTAWVEQVPTDITKHHWHVSYVKGESKYVAIDQSDTSAVENFVNGFVESKVGTEKIGEAVWMIYSGAGDEVIATSMKDGNIILVTANTYPLLLKVLSKIS